MPSVHAEHNTNTDAYMPIDVLPALSVTICMWHHIVQMMILVHPSESTTDQAVTKGLSLLTHATSQVSIYDTH